MEHSLSPEAMDRFVRFFEFLHVCPTGRRDWLEKFHCCSRVQDDVSACEHVCDGIQKKNNEVREEPMTISNLRPGEQGKVSQVNARGAVRQRLLDMGLLPDVIVRVERLAPTGDPVWISLKGSQIALRRNEAEAVLISAM